jgi:hypothetical protein
MINFCRIYFTDIKNVACLKDITSLNNFASKDKRVKLIFIDLISGFRSHQSRVRFARRRSR